MPPTRLPFWMTASDRAALATAIIELCGSTAVVPSLRTMLEAVALELGVAEARDQIWPTAGQVRRQTGSRPDVLPVRMSAEERAAVLTLPTLHPGVRGRLAEEFGRSSP